MGSRTGNRGSLLLDAGVFAASANAAARVNLAGPAATVAGTMVTLDAGGKVVVNAGGVEATGNG